MRITESRLRRLIRSVLIEAVVRPKPAVDHHTLFREWLKTVFLGDETNFMPFVKAVYKTKLAQDGLLSRWEELKRIKEEYQADPFDTFFNYLNDRVNENEGIFKKEMLGDFFIENDVNPYHIFEYLEYFINPKKDLDKFGKHKMPSSVASSKDFAFDIDSGGWAKLKVFVDDIETLSDVASGSRD